MPFLEPEPEKVPEGPKGGQTWGEFSAQVTPPSAGRQAVVPKARSLRIPEHRWLRATDGRAVAVATSDGSWLRVLRDERGIFSGLEEI